MTSTTTASPTPLCKACLHGDLDAVASLLASGVDYLESDDTGKTALHWAVAGRHLPVIEILLGHHRPSTQEPRPVITLTYQELVCLYAKTRPVVTPIELAAQLDDEAIFKALLNRLEPFADTIPVFNGVWPPISRKHALLDVDFTEPLLAKNDNLPSRNDFKQEGDWRAELLGCILQLAIQDNKFVVAEMVLRVGANPNAIYGQMELCEQWVYQPLDIAAAYSQKDPAYIRLLLKYGANPNPDRRAVQTPLSTAMSSWNEGAVTALLEGGALPNAPDGTFITHISRLFCLFPTEKEPDRDTPFLFRTFQSLLDAGATIDSSTDISPCVGLMSRGCLTFLKELVARGADITSCDIPLRDPGWDTLEYRETLDIFAAAYGTETKLRDAISSRTARNGCYDLALDYGLVVDGPINRHGSKALARRLVGDNPLLGHLETSMESTHGSLYLAIDCIDLLCSLFRGPKTSAPTPGQVDSFIGVLRVLDQAGEIDPAGVTRALFEVVKNYDGGDGIECIVEGLMDLGASICRPDSVTGWPWEPTKARFSDILALSAIHGQEGVLSALLQRLPQQTESSHPNWPTWFRQEEFNSLRLTYNNNVDTVLACLKSSALVFIPNLADDERPLLVSILRGDVPAVRTLVALGVDINQDSHNAWPPLHTATEGGHETIVDILLQANASVDAHTRYRLPDESGHARRAGISSDSGTALHLAAIRGRLRIVGKLLDYGADVHAKTGGGTTFVGGTALDLLLLYGPVAPQDGHRDKSLEWLHPDRLSAALLLVERGARFSKAIAERWKNLKLDEVLEKFEGHPSLWDKFVEGEWDNGVEQGRD
ncbi:hypothetical protein BKA70DRAFT_1494904 [Coprinopsis sp. MPI-PUGE-AT-0042]|nr:hypothetical protein BKA70DRAFT_1494904 [Coprinopsis sp. MPI-PUGE-AT-0042]